MHRQPHPHRSHRRPGGALWPLTILSAAVCLLPWAAPAKADTGNSPPKVELLAPGAEPREALRFTIKRGAKQSLEMIMTMGMNMEVGGAKNAVKMPPMRNVMDITANTVDGETIGMAFVLTHADVIESPGIDPNVSAAMKSALSGIVGLKGTGTVTNRGINLGMKLEIPASAPPQVKQTMAGAKDAMSKMSAPLPEAPVGLGGRWKVTQTLTQNGMTFVQTSTYAITAMKGKLIDLDVTVALKAEPQDMQLPGVPTKVHLSQFSGSGRGTTQISLDQLVPVKAIVRVSTKMRSEIEAGGQTQAMKMDMDMDLKMKAIGHE